MEHEIEIVLLPAPRPRLERGTYCLGGTFEVSPYRARCRLTCHSYVLTVAGRGLTEPGNLRLLAPRLAPRNLVSNANVWLSIRYSAPGFGVPSRHGMPLAATSSR